MKSFVSWRTLFVLPVVAALWASPAKADNVIDLTTVGASGFDSAMAGFYQQAMVQPAGSGVIDSFVRIQTNNVIESGYNTDGRPLQFDENNSPTFTRSLTTSSVPIVNINGTNYRQFMLDINQQNSNPLLSLNQIQVFQTNDPNLLGATVDANGNVSFGSNATLVYNLQTGGATQTTSVTPTTTIELDYSLEPGSGSADMYAYIPDALFGTDQYVVLYSKFGVPNPNNDGYEEWAVIMGPSSVIPEPSSLALGLIRLGGLALAGLRRFRGRSAVASA